MRHLIDIVENTLAGPDKMDGWWIDRDGEFHDCDHRHKWHHEDIAAFHFKVSGERAEEKAIQDGWIRGSWYDKALTITWHYDPTPKAKNVLLKWVRDYGPAFSSIYVEGPENEEEFNDAASALADIRSQLSS